MKRFFLIAAFLIAVFAPLPVFAHSQLQIVEMTADGFVPAETTIDKNSTVVFINKDNKTHWPASDVHPTHEIYPQFDPKRDIEPGKSWSFKFTKVGKWRIHDHLFPHFRGQITVLEEPGEPESSEDIPSSPTFWEKIKNLFTQITNKLKVKRAVDISNLAHLPADQQIKKVKDMSDVEGAEKTWQKIKEVFKDQSGSSGNIHDLAHLAGSLLYKKEGIKGLSKCTSNFAFGCYHGFLDEAFSKNLDNLNEAQNICLKLGIENSGPVASCIHGIGHGIASFHLVKDLKKSLSDCRKLTSGNEFCFDGVFMEFVRSAPENFYKKEDLLYPCNSLENEFAYAYSFSCGRNQPSVLMSRFKMGFNDVVGACSSSSSTPFKQACFDALGFSLAATLDTNKIISGCLTIEENEFVLRCIKSAAGELVFQEVPNWEEKSGTVCKSLESGRNECLQYIDKLISEYGRVRKINFTPIKKGDDVNAYLRKQLKKCYDNGGKDGCYKQVAEVLYADFGLTKTLELLKTNEQYPEVFARCHEVTHYLSRFEYEKQKDIAKAYAHCDSTCHGGCYHGTLEAYLKDKVGQKDFALKNDFSKTCGNRKDYSKPIEYNECLHGMGHAAMFVTEMELKESLKLCDTIEDQENRERCYTGVFMENSSSSTSFDHASIYIKKDDPFYPCNALEEKYLSLCWQYQSSYFSIINHQDWSKVSQMCLQIPNKYQDKCFRTIGTNQVGFTTSLQTMKQNCDFMPTPHFQDICVAGVISSLSYRFVGDAKKMIDFCSAVNSQNKESCFKQIGTALLDWDKNKDVAKKECSKIPDSQAISWCMISI